MTRAEQSRRAEAFRAMHGGPRLLVLPNAWDAVTAKLYETEGFAAIGTTSAGIAASLGYPDGQKMSLEENLLACRRIVAAVDIPVSIDMEAGYAGCLETLKESVAAAVDCGAAGINLEDSAKAGCGGAGGGALVEIGAQCERIAAAREAATCSGIPLVINARTDVCLGHGAASDAWLAGAIERGNAYRRAGADCIFVPDMGTLGEAEIEILTREIDAPLNVIAGPRTPDIVQLERLGVARLSFGPRPMRAALAFLQAMSREWRTKGTFSRLVSSPSLSYEDVNNWFARH